MPPMDEDGYYYGPEEVISHINDPTVIIDNPEYVVYASTEPQEKFGTNDAEDLDVPTNTLLELLIARTKRISTKDAVGVCIKEQPMLIAISTSNGKVWKQSYTTVH